MTKQFVPMVSFISLIVLAGSGVLVPQARTEADVYTRLFELGYHGTPPMVRVVKDVAVLMPTLSGSSADWVKQFDDAPVALRRAAGQPFPTTARLLDVAELPAGTKVVSERAIATIFARGVDEGWAAFRQQYGSEGWLSFSEVLFTPDVLDALVYYERRCGSLCGEGGYAWLHRDSTDSRWSIKKTVIRWKS